MDVLITCKYEEDLIKNRCARVFTTLYVNFSEAQGQITLESVVVSGRNLNSSKNEGASVHKITPIISLWGFFQTLKGN